MDEPIKYFELPGPVLFESPPAATAEGKPIIRVPVDFSFRITLELAPWVEVRICGNPDDN